MIKCGHGWECREMHRLRRARERDANPEAEDYARRRRELRQRIARKHALIEQLESQLAQEVTD